MKDTTFNELLDNSAKTMQDEHIEVLESRIIELTDSLRAAESRIAEHNQAFKALCSVVANRDKRIAELETTIEELQGDIERSQLDSMADAARGCF